MGIDAIPVSQNTVGCNRRSSLLQGVVKQGVALNS